MILQIRADAGRIVDHGNPVLRQQAAGPDARQLEQLRRIDRAGGQNNFAFGVQNSFHAITQDLNPGRTLTREQDAGSQGVRLDS
jgi:hypothetical protein